MKGTVAILCGGGPAPGMNTVVGSIAKVFLQNGYRVIGLHEGYKHLFEANPPHVEIDFSLADYIFSRGGSYLVMSRHKPKDDEFSTEFFINYEVDLLVTVGGDDTASTANRIAKYLQNNNVKIQNLHVPKTIDNDLPLPEGVPTFGYNTAKNEGVNIAKVVYEDARTSGNWFVVAAMGRSAGHLAFGIGDACHYPMMVIPEMFNKTEITIDKIVNLAVSAIIKRKILGINYGAIMISEGVFHDLSTEELKNSGVQFSYDDHGHPELGKISKSTLFNQLLEDKLNELGIPVKSRPVEIGYEVRTVDPIGYDLTYCSLLGYGTYKLFSQGITGCMVCVNNIGDVSPLYLKDLENAEGKIPPRLVDVDSQYIQGVIESNMHYVSPDDYDNAKGFVPNPEAYDFKKILNW